MDIYHIVLSNAFVALLTAPLRRLRYLLTVEDALIEEGVLPPQGFGGTVGCVRFLYHASGGSLCVFYRGALLDALGLVVKYELQRIISIPISRRVPLRMQQAVLATTFVHTALVYFTVAPVQTALDTITVNSVTTFTVAEEEGTGAAPASRSAAGKGKTVPSSTPPKARLRFSGSWETAKYLAGHFPVLSMVSRLYLLDFGCRYVTSLANNKILAWLMIKTQKHYNGVEMTYFQRLMMYAGIPLVASLAVNALTYPFATYPVAHFLRLRYYERRDEAAAQDNLASARYTNTTSPPAKGDAHSHNRTSGSGAAVPPVLSTDSLQKPGEAERFWWEEILRHAVHPEVRHFLWVSMYGHEGSASALGLDSTSTTPAAATPTSQQRQQQQSPVGAGGRSTSKRGIRQVYRGFGLVVASTLLSSALAMALNQAVDFVVHHSH